MHLSRNRHLIFLITAVTVITLPAVGWCKPTRPQRPGSKAARRDSVRPAAPPEPAGGAANGSSALTAALPAAEKRFKSRNKPMRRKPGKTGKDACRAGTVTEGPRGRFYISGQIVANGPHTGYQADSAVSVGAQEGQSRVRGQRLRGAEEGWRRLQPAVACGDDAMTLTVNRRQAAQLLLDQANESSVPLSRLPPQCGYSVQTTWRDLSFLARYDACHVMREVDDYVLPLLWRGAAVRMSCPVSHTQPQSVGPGSLCCFLHGMSVRLQSLAATELEVKVRGEWTPLLDLAQQCGYTLERRADETLIAAPFISCGITVKDGKHTLSFQTGEKVLVLACPVAASEESRPTHSHHPPSLPNQPAPETVETPQWAPPFYLAPPYYPHPAHHHKDPAPGPGPGPGSSPDPYPKPDPPLPTLVPPIPDHPFGQQPLPPIDLPPEHQNLHSHRIPAGEPYKHFGTYSVLTSADETPAPSRMDSHSQGLPERPDATGIQMQVPPLHDSSHMLNPYYHYYHHPKIPRPGSAENSDPASKAPPDLSLTPPDNLETPYQLQPAPEDPSPPAVSHTNPAPLPPQPHPQHHDSYYSPLIARGELDDLAAPNPNTDPSDNRPVTRPSQPQAHNEYGSNPGVVEPRSQRDHSGWVQRPLWPAVMDEEVNDGQGDSGAAGLLHLEQPSLNYVHDPPHYAYFYHPYPVYQMHHPSLGAADIGAPQTPEKEASDPQLQTSPEPPQHLPHVKLAPLHHDVPSEPPHPLYDDHQLFYQPGAPVDDPGGAGGEGSEKEAVKPETRPPSDSDGWAVHAAETGDPGMAQPPRNCHHPPLLIQHLQDSFLHPGEESAQDGPDDGDGDDDDDYGRDHPEANLYTPPASPYSLGPGSDFDCSVSFGCCSHPGKDCTMVTEPLVASPSEVSNVSCTLQRLTSDPDLYIIPMDDCGLSKHVAGHSNLHPLETHPDLSSGQEDAPARMTVECKSSPGSAGDLRFHVIDQAPAPPLGSNPATVTVQLKIATDETFARFHPEAHLPLSLVQGRPLYVEARLLDPREPGLVLLVHACMAHTRAAQSSWMLIYDGCRSWGDSQLLPPPHSNPHHIQRIRIPSFLPKPLGSSSYMTKGEFPDLDDPEIYFLCLIEVCSATDGLCSLGCGNGPSSGMK